MRKFTNLLFFWLGALMIVVALTLATILLVTDFYQDTLYGGKRILFICMLIAYSIYRAFRTYAVFKQRNDAEE